MPLEIIKGRAGSGKSEFCLNEMLKAKNEGRRAIYIVPEQFSHRAEDELIKKTGFVSEEILATSFKRLSFLVLKESGKSGVYADSRVKSMIMAKTLIEMAPKLKIFAGASKNSGFSQCLLDVISEFKRAVLSPFDILKCSEEIKDNEYFKQKMQELGKIYESYENALSRDFSDSFDIVTIASEYIAESGIFKDTKVYIDEFFRFTKQEILFIKALLAQKVDVSVSILADDLDNSGVFDPSLETKGRLISLCTDAGDTFLGERFLEEPKRFVSPEISHLEREYTNYPPKKYEKSTEDISLYVANDINSEIINVASGINRLVKKDNYSFSDIGIIAGNFESYRDILETVFKDYDIPVFIDDKRSVLTHPVMLMLFSVFDIIADGFNTKDVLSYIKTGLSPLSDLEADILENHVIKSGIKYSDWTDDRRFVLRTKSVFDSENELSEEEQAQLISIKNKIVSPILALKEDLSKSRKVKHRVSAFTQFFENTGLFEKINEFKDVLIKMRDLKRAEEFASVYTILGETFSQMAEFIGESQMGLDKLKAVLSAGFSELSIGVVPTECDQVFFGDENRSVIKNVRSLFVIGANSGAFPADVQAGGIFTENERLYLNKQGFEIAPTAEKRMLDSRFSVYNVLAVPKEKLFLSYPLADMEGKGYRPSQVISKIKRILPDLSVKYGDLSRGVTADFVTNKKSAFNYSAGKMASGEDDALKLALTEVLKEDEEFCKKINTVEERIKKDYHAERLIDENIELLYGKSLKGSVSRFEKFNECPFSYFMQYGLKAKERKSLSPEATDMGSLLHLVIEIFSKELYDDGKSFAKITDSEAETLISGIIDELLEDSFIKKLYSQNKFSTFSRRLKSLAVRSALAICAHVKKGEFEPCAFEFAFDENGDSKPIVLTLPNGRELTIIGKIDRVDKLTIGDEVYIKIIDYKSGQKKFSLADIYNKKSLQLTVYLMAYMNSGDNLNPGGMFYFRLTDPINDAKGEETQENIDAEILKKFKMSGLVLSDSDIINAMEKGKTGYLSTIPVYVKKDGDISLKTSSVASREDFKTLSDYVNKALIDIGNEIFTGNVDISPLKSGKNTACDYCKFSSCCGAGKYLEIEYRDALSLEKEEVFDEMKKAIE